jgi:P-type conjugative transfer protein TrbL
MVWTFGLMALRRADIGEFFTEFIRFTVTTGFFWWLLSNGPAMAMAVINSLRKIGAEAGGLPMSISPSTPISIGFDIVKKAFTGLSWVHPIDNLGIVLISAATVIAMAVVAANILIALVTAWSMSYAGVFILGFGGARWTSDMAISYFKAMLGIGLELMTMTLLVAVAVSVIDGFYRDLDGSSVYELLLVLCVCVVLAILIHTIPARVAALVGGGSGASVGVGTVMGGAAMAAAAVATGGAAIAAGAAGIAGGTQALMAAFSKANASTSGIGSSGMSADAAGGGAAAGSTGGGGNGAGSVLAAAMGDSGAGMSGSIGYSASPSATSSAVGNNSGSPGEVKPGRGMAAAGAMAAKVGRVAAGTAVNLAQGSWDVAKAKASDMKDSALERIGETTGGKIAAAIKAREAAVKADAETAQFSEDSLSEGSKPIDAQAEIAAFRDRESKA